MTEAEISEIRTAIATIHHLTDDDPLEGWKYMMLKAVLPLLEYATNPVKTDEGMGAKLLIGRYALEISKVVNYKRPNTTTICDLEVKDDRARPGFTDKEAPGWSDFAKNGGQARRPATISNATLKRLQAEGRIQEKK